MAVEFSAIIPCYNEAANIAGIAARFAEKDDGLCELVLVDNGSSDGTAAAIALAAAQYPFVRFVSVPINLGYGHGILQGLSAAQGDWLGWSHGDLQCDPADLRQAFALARSCGEKTFVKGERSGRSFADHIFTAGMAAFETFCFAVPLRDINAQPTVFHRSFFAQWKNPPADFTLDLYAYALARRLGLKVLRLPVRLTPRHAGVSSWNRGIGSRIALSLNVIKASVRIKKSLP